MPNHELTPARLTCLALVVAALDAAVKGAIAIREYSATEFSLPVFDRSGHPWWFIARLAVVSAQDAAVALSLAFLAITIIARVRRAAGPLLALAYLGAALAMIMNVVNIQVFHVYQHFLDPALLTMAQFGGHGYLQEYAPLPLVLVLIFLPPLCIGIERWFIRYWSEDWKRAASVFARPWIGLPLIAALWGISLWAPRGVLNEAYAGYARSPHWALLHDWLAGPPRAAEETCGADTSDFATDQAQPAFPGKPGRKLNLILVVWDGVPAKFLEPYGCKLPVTPELTRLAPISTVFERFYSNAAISAPSLLPVFASVLNAPHSYITDLEYPGFPMPHGPESLRRQGWRSFFVGDDAWSGLGRRYLGGRFDVAVDSEAVWSDGGKPRTRTVFHDGDTSQALLREYLDEAGPGPFYMQHWTGAAHPPFYPGPGPATLDRNLFPAAARARDPVDHENFLRALWRADRRLGELSRELERRGLAENTVIALTADHGYGWGEHGYWSYGVGTYDEIVRVPFILIWPGLKSYARRVPLVGGHVDMWPTLADLIGAAPHPDWQGRSLFGRFPAERRRAYFACIGQMGVREGRFKFMWKLEERRELLYDLDADPEELSDVAAQHPEIASRLRCQLVAWAREQRRHFETRARHK